MSLRLAGVVAPGGRNGKRGGQGSVVPGFGSFSPCPWALGPEVKGTKDHWMGSAWPATSYGHFGKSGALLLIDPVAQVAVVALSSEPFGQWAVDLWPTWTNEMHRQLVPR